jgi:putative oxidoreductase
MNIDKIFDDNAGLIDLVGRLLLAAIFVLTGFHQIPDFVGTQEFMVSKGVPGFLLIVVIALEIVGGLALIIGWKVRMFAFLLAGYSLLAALLFHTNFADEQQYYSFMKNLAMAGGLLFLTAKGAGSISLDSRSKA